MTSDGVTTRQKEILKLVHSELAENGFAPSVREIAAAVGLSSPSTVQAHLKMLEQHGLIFRDTSKPRALIVTKAGLDYLNISDDDVVDSVDLKKEIDRTMVSLPLVGQVAAGVPILAEQNIEDTLMLPISVVGDKNSFLLKVRGDSMIEAGIMNGDYIAVEETSDARNGEIVVALIEDEATVKTYYREEDRIRLQPENRNMEPIYTRDASIIGRVTALIRSF